MCFGSKDRSSSDEYEYTHDPDSGESLGVTVALAVADVLQQQPEDLVEPLDGVVDPDALDALFAPRADGTSRRGGRVAFTFNGCRVRMYADGRILIRRDDRPAEPSA